MTMMNNPKKPDAPESGAGEGGSFSGRWTKPEEEYAEALMDDFRAGALNIPTGTKLRGFLADKLRCWPKRISKKYECSGYNGRQQYINKVQAMEPKDLEKREARRERLRSKFEARRTEKELAKKGIKVSAAAAAAAAATDSKPVAPVSDGMRTLSSPIVAAGVDSVGGLNRTAELANENVPSVWSTTELLGRPSQSGVSIFPHSAGQGFLGGGAGTSGSHYLETVSSPARANILEGAPAPQDPSLAMALSNVRSGLGLGFGIPPAAPFNTSMSSLPGYSRGTNEAMLRRALFARGSANLDVSSFHSPFGVAGLNPTYTSFLGQNSSLGTTLSGVGDMNENYVLRNLLWRRQMEELSQIQREENQRNAFLEMHERRLRLERSIADVGAAHFARDPPQEESKRPNFGSDNEGRQRKRPRSS